MKKWPDADTGIGEDRERRGYTTNIINKAYTWTKIVKRCVWVKSRLIHVRMEAKPRTWVHIVSHRDSELSALQNNCSIKRDNYIRTCEQMMSTSSLRELLFFLSVSRNLAICRPSYPFMSKNEMLSSQVSNATMPYSRSSSHLSNELIQLAS